MIASVIAFGLAVAAVMPVDQYIKDFEAANSEVSEDASAEETTDPDYTSAL